MSMGIEARGAGALMEEPTDDEREFESLFAAAGVRAWDVLETGNWLDKEAAFDKLEELFATPNILQVRLPGEEEVYQAYTELAKQLGRPRRYQLNGNGDVVSLDE